MKRAYKGRVGLAAAIGLGLRLATGHVVGLAIRSDNMPFLLALGALVGLCAGLVAALVVCAVHH